MPAGGSKRRKLSEVIESSAPAKLQSTAPSTKTPADKKDAKPKNNESKSKDKVKKEGAGSDDSGSESAEYEVDYIEGHRLSKDNESIEFFVRWKDYSF
jgi:hypothetical protein